MPERASSAAAAAARARRGRDRGRRHGHVDGYGHGFTLIEMLIGIVVISFVGATTVSVLRLALQTDVMQRARGGGAGDVAHVIHRLGTEVRSAVSNSVRSAGSACVEFVPTSLGGRYRRAADGADSRPVEPGVATTEFDVLSPPTALPAVGDWVVVGNTDPSGVYGGVNRAAISAVAVPDPRYGRLRLTIAPTTFPIGYDEARFVVVPDAQQAVSYVCDGADGTLDADGTARGRLMRAARYGFVASPAGCVSAALATTVVTGVSRCRFSIAAGDGATQQIGRLGIELELTRRGETVGLAWGVPVDNVP